MFGIGSTELLVIVVVALVVLGPKSLPGIAKTVGKVMGEVRRVSTEFQRTMNVEVAREEYEERKKEVEKDLFPQDDSAKASAANASPSAQTASTEEKKTAAPSDASTAKTATAPVVDTVAQPVSTPETAAAPAAEGTSPLAAAVAQAENEAQGKVKA